MASKKSFRTDINPALQFISQPADQPGAATPVAPEQAPEGKASQGYRRNPLYVETKSRRLQLLVRPSLHERLKERATREGKSVNELVHMLLERALKDL